MKISSQNNIHGFSAKSLRRLIETCARSEVAAKVVISATKAVISTTKAVISPTKAVITKAAVPSKVAVGRAIARIASTEIEVSSAVVGRGLDF
jgi:hypothetical protein